MKKHLKHLKNPFPGTNFISGHFRPANRPNRDFSKFPKICQNRDFFKKSIFHIVRSSVHNMHIKHATPKVHFQGGGKVFWHVLAQFLSYGPQNFFGKTLGYMK